MININFCFICVVQVLCYFMFFAVLCVLNPYISLCPLRWHEQFLCNHYNRWWVCTLSRSIWLIFTFFFLWGRFYLRLLFYWIILWNRYVHLIDYLLLHIIVFIYLCRTSYSTCRHWYHQNIGAEGSIYRTTRICLAYYMFRVPWNAESFASVPRTFSCVTVPEGCLSCSNVYNIIVFFNLFLLFSTCLVLRVGLFLQCLCQRKQRL